MVGNMTSLERVLAVIKGETPDYVPVFPLLNEYAAKLLKVSELEYYQRPELLAEGQMALVKYFDYDFLLAFTYLAREIAALGGTIQFHDDASPTIGGLYAKSLEDVASVEIPDFENNPETQVVLDQIRKLVEISEGQYPIVGIATGPFSWPTLVMGNDQWLTALIMEEPDAIKPVLDKAREFAIAWSNAQLKAGCHVIGLVEGSATKSVIPEDVFTDLVQPLLKETIPQIQAPSIVLGVGGEFEPYLSYLNDVGAAGVIISNDDNLQNCLANANNLIIAGNVSNLEFFDYTSQNINTITKEAMILGKGHRFIFGTQYVLPTMVAEDKIKQLVAAARKYGKY